MTAIGRVQFFADINILDVSPFGAKRWKKAVNQFEIMLQPVDEKMASLLKPKLNNHLRNPRQVIILLASRISFTHHMNIVDDELY